MTDGLAALTRYFEKLPTDTPVVVAYSGGVDSSVVASVATHVLGTDQVTAVFFDSPLIDDEDRQWAKTVSEDARFNLSIIEFNPLDIDAVRFNREDRCYHCKSALLGILKERYPGAIVCDGTNADDDPSRRPGMRALKERGVRSPLRECGLGKDETRATASRLELTNADRPSKPCLSVGFPTGSDLTMNIKNNVTDTQSCN
jgi:uncharacterized protein